MPAEYFTYTGRDGDIVPHDVTYVHVHKSVKVIPAHAFNGYPNLEELDCDVGVEKVEAWALSQCPSLRRVIMPGVRVVVEEHALVECEALTVVECGKLEIIGHAAFKRCESLRSINLPSAKVVKAIAFIFCYALTDVIFSDELESIEWMSFKGCRSLRRITLPLKDGVITHSDTFQGCEKLEHVDLVGGIHKTVAALQLEEWRNDMNEEIDAINQILPHTPAGTDSYWGRRLW